MALPNSTTRTIVKLDQHTVNRIAAGEVIHRPASALKELLENSLDAGATTINVLAKGGGLKLLQIQDNGHGILRDDFGKVCERFATSKLRAYEDLEAIETFGFRGEALASISHVSQVTITSMTAGAPCAYRACYADGALVPARPGETDSSPKPCAGTKGTLIVAEDMFYNVPARRNAMKGPGEEYGKLLPVVQAYAIDNPTCAVSCRKGIDGQADLATGGKSEGSSSEVVRMVYGRALAKELIEVSGEESSLGLKVNGLVTNANHSSKRLTFLLFINKRLVESVSLRKAVEEVYAAYLPKGGHPFVYLSLRLPPNALDVNVHPTKREVHFLDAEKVVASVQGLVKEKLIGANASRTFLAQAVLPGMVNGARDGTGSAEKDADASGSGDAAAAAAADDDATGRGARSGGGGSSGGGGGGGGGSSSTKPAKPAYDPRKLVRTGGGGMAAGELDKYIERTADWAGASRAQAPAAAAAAAPGKRRRDDEPPASPPGAHDEEAHGPAGAAAIVPFEAGEEEEDDDAGPAAALVVPQWSCGAQRIVKRAGPASSAGERRWAPCELTSIHNLLRRVTAQLSRGLHALFSQHTYVGVVDRRYVLLQHLTRLYVVHIGQSSEAFCYQLALRGWGNHAAIRLTKPISIAELYLLALEVEANEQGKGSGSGGGASSSFEAGEAAAHAAALLDEKGEMLEEYLSLTVQGGCLCALPQLIEGYVPPLNGLPKFVKGLAEEVDWTTEQPCFEGCARQLARLYRIDEVGEASEGEEGGAVAEGEEQQGCSAAWTIQHVLLPAMRKSYEPPNAHATNGAVVQVACTEQLYKIFERC